MKKLITILFAAACLISTTSLIVNAKDNGSGYANPKSGTAKKMAEWTKTTTYTPATETSGAIYQSAVYGDAMMIVTTATYDTSNKIQSLTYTTYDKKDREKFTGEFTLDSTYDDAWVSGVSKNAVLLTQVTGSWGNYTKYTLTVYKITKKSPKKVGRTLDLTDLSKYISKIIFSGSKIIISFKVTDAEGNQTDNYVRVYNMRFSKYVEISGGANTDILSSTMSHTFEPKYWVSEDTSYSADYTKTTKHVIIYKK